MLAIFNQREQTPSHAAHANLLFMLYESLTLTVPCRYLLFTSQSNEASHLRE